MARPGLFGDLSGDLGASLTPPPACKAHSEKSEAIQPVTFGQKKGVTKHLQAPLGPLLENLVNLLFNLGQSPLISSPASEMTL